MKGYYQDPKRTAEALVTDGNGKVWLRSGDEALVDEEGFVRITGRIKDIIIRGGENIYPPEIENVLLQHEMVGNASVVGLPDLRYGEVIAAFVVVKEGVKVVEVENGDKNGVDDAVEVEGATLRKTDVQSWVADRLSKMMVPKHVFWIDKMPLTASGKIEKYKLRELGIRILDEDV